MPIRIKLPARHDHPLTAAATSDCAPCQAARERSLADAERSTAARSVRLAAADEEPQPSRQTWAGPIIFEDQLTGDGRYIQRNALTWDTLPIPVRYVEADTGEHNGAVAVGRVLSITRRPGGVIWGEGDFDSSPVAVEAARKVSEEVQNGVSADLDNVSFTVKVAKELLPDAEEIETATEQEVDENGRVTVLDIDADAEVMDIDDARIRAVTIVGIPAFEGARINLAEGDAPFPPDEAESPTDLDGTLPDGSECSCDPDDDNYSPDCDCGEPAEEEGEEASAEALVAAAIPTEPPSGWFTNPELPGPTPLTITDSGAVYGHLAVWGTCHRSFADRCVTPPHSASNYAHFRTGSVLTSDGQLIPVGHITLDTFHANKQLTAADTLAHYEHTGFTAADVAAGEDAYGIWVAGALRPGVTPEQVRTLRASPLSGDWRGVGGNLELIAALAVNVPGFPVPRAEGVLAASGRPSSLVASGIVQVRPRTHYGEGRRRQSSGPHLHFEQPTAARTEDDISAEALAWLRSKTEPQHNAALAARMAREVAALQLAREVEG